MRVPTIVRALGVGAGALIVATLIYAAVDQTKIIEVNTPTELDKILNEHPLVVAEFYNPECPVCQQFQKSHIFEDAARSLPHITFIKVSSVQGKDLHKEYSITHYPTFIYFKDKKQVPVYLKEYGEEKAYDRFEGFVDGAAFMHQVTDIFGRAERESAKE